MVLADMEYDWSESADAGQQIMTLPVIHNEADIVVDRIEAPRLC